MRQIAHHRPCLIGPTNSGSQRLPDIEAHRSALSAAKAMNTFVNGRSLRNLLEDGGLD